MRDDDLAEEGRVLMMFRRRSEKTAAADDAADLINKFGQQAFAAAGDLSWREDAGLMTTRSPGHWYRVQQEIGRRLSCDPAHVPMIQGIADRMPLDHDVMRV